MPTTPIKHLSFDLGNTLVRENPDFVKTHNELKYQTYAEAIKQPLTDHLRHEFDEKLEKFATTSALFASMGFPSDHWQNRFNTLDRSQVYYFDQTIWETMRKLNQLIPLSIFTTIKKDAAYETLKIAKLDPSLFQFIISGDDTPNRKPALDGFKLVIEKAKLPAENILYVGDRVNADIIPAKKTGMQTCLVFGESSEADYCVQDFEKLLEITIK